MHQVQHYINFTYISIIFLICIDLYVAVTSHFYSTINQRNAAPSSNGNILSDHFRKTEGLMIKFDIIFLITAFLFN